MADSPSLDPYPMLIAGEWVRTAHSADIVSPWDGRIVGRVCTADQALLDRAIDAAHAALTRSCSQPPHERAEILQRISEGLRSRRSEFAETILAESGKPITLAEAEVDRAAITFSAAAAEARRSGGQSLDAAAYSPGAGHTAFIRRFPAGVVYGMTPFNFPLNLVAHKLAPALACGAPIILKPSPRTPLSTIKLAALAVDSGAGAGTVSVICCGNELATRPIDDRRIKVVSFTGSAAVGWGIAKQAAGKKVTLELGGNAAVIVHRDADIEAAVPAIVAGAFGYAGQSCISVQRILVHSDIYANARERLITRTKSHALSGDPARRNVINGPLIDRASQQRILNQIASAQAAGAKLLVGGAADGVCVTAALLEHVPRSQPLWAEEAFGPVAVLEPYDDFDDALTAVNASRYGLQAGLFTRDMSLAYHAFANLDVGGVMINQPPTFRIDNLPYGGVKDSGVGREGVQYAMEEMTEPRVMVIKVEQH